MPPLYTTSDFAIMAVRSVLVPVIAMASHGFLGLFAYTIAYLVYYWVLKLAFGMDRLAALDEFFLLDNDKNIANIVTVVKTDRVRDTDYDLLRKRIIELSLKNDRSRHRLYKFLAEYYFVELSEEKL